MKKLNNKGSISIVELIIVFVILIILILGMMRIIMNLKDKNNQVLFEKKMLEFKTSIVKEIQDDLIKNTFYETEGSGCNDLGTCTLKFRDDVGNVSTKIIIVDKNEKTITYDNVIYEIPEKERIEFKDVSNPVVKIKDNKFLIIDIPYYTFQYENNINYGIHIVFPITLHE